VPNVKKSGALTYPDPLGPSRRPVVGETFTFTIYFLQHNQYSVIRIYPVGLKTIKLIFLRQR